MKNIEIKYVLYIMMFIAIVIFLLTKQLNPSSGILTLILDSLSTTITIISFLSFLFSTYLWKLKFFKGWLVKIPDLNGVWKGELYSTWNNTNIATELEIKQSLFKMSCKIRTLESESISISSDFLIDEDNQKQQLTYTYVNTSDLKYRKNSPIHYGTVILNIGEDTLKGVYWTDRKTAGDIKLKYKRK